MLTRAYSAFHLDPYSESQLQDALIPIPHLHGSLQCVKNTHLTIAYYGDIEDSVLEGKIHRIRSAVRTLQDRAIHIDMPEYFQSDISGEDIFYLPVRSARLFDTLRTVRTPHITLIKGQQLTQETIHTVLMRIREVLGSTEALTLDMTRIFGHATHIDGQKYIGEYRI